jgi:hypothetical protein
MPEMNINTHETTIDRALTPLRGNTRAGFFLVAHSKTGFAAKGHANSGYKLPKATGTSSIGQQSCQRIRERGSIPGKIVHDPLDQGVYMV